MFSRLCFHECERKLEAERIGCLMIAECNLSTITAKFLVRIFVSADNTILTVGDALAGFS